MNRPEINVYRLNEYEYWAGTDLESCIAKAIDVTRCTRDEIFEPEFANEYENKVLSEITFVDCVDKSLADLLDDLCNHGAVFPTFFCAHTQYNKSMFMKSIAQEL